MEIYVQNIGHNMRYKLTNILPEVEGGITQMTYISDGAL